MKKKIYVGLGILSLNCFFVACGTFNSNQKMMKKQIEHKEVLEQNKVSSETASTSNDIEFVNLNDVKAQLQLDSQTDEEIAFNTSNLSASDLLDKAIAGEIPVNYTDWEGNNGTYYLTDLSLNVSSEPSDEMYEYWIEGRYDVDNDGEDELSISGMYGGMYIDARKGQVYQLAEGDGTALWLGCVEYKGKAYICYSNTSHVGYETFVLEQFNGDGEVVDSFSLEAQYNDELDESAICYYDDREISAEEYFALRKEIFGY